MAINLVKYLSTGGSSPRLWVDFKDYTKKLLLKQDENPWTTPAKYMSYYTQAHGLVSAEVVVLDIWDLYSHWMEEDKDAIPSMAGKRRVTVALKVMLAAFQPRELLAEVITAMDNNYGSAVPIVLVLPSPRSFLVKAHTAANGGEVEADESNVDTASMYLADYLRYFSEMNISGVLLVEDPELMPASTEDLTWYQPIFNIAKHYRWDVGIYLPFEGEGFDVPEGVSLSITPPQSGTESEATGIDITQSLWAGKGAGIESVSDNNFYYFSIPEDSKPEPVLETISQLRGK